MLHYASLSSELSERIAADRAAGRRSPYATPDDAVLRRDPRHDTTFIPHRPAFVRDAEKILHSHAYNRYADKTQVFSFYRNDDLTRRALHVQLVSRIARNIGRALGLNEDLIEAIALGHDIGHTPFGHAGESCLNKIFHAETGLSFSHNVHSVRVLDGICPYNISLQTLNGILAHNGESERPIYELQPMDSFAALDAAVAACLADPSENLRILPSTPEGCVVRVSDLIAYLGKDRQDAVRAHLITAEEEAFPDSAIGRHNAEIINNLSVSVIEHSYGKPYIAIGEDAFAALAEAKRNNYDTIYLSEAVSQKTKAHIVPMFERLYFRLRQDLTEGKTASPIYRLHIAAIDALNYRRDRAASYREETSPDQIVVDYIAGMTDDYFVELYAHLFPDAPSIPYVGYFSDL